MIDLVIDFADGNDKQKLFNLLKNLKKVKYVIRLHQYRKKRSIRQNGYYRGVVVKYLCADLGFSEDEMHEYLKIRFNPIVKIIKATGEEITIGGSTSDFNTLQMEEYLEQVRIWALTDLDILIPLPNQVINE